jgi:hypothetical protein
MLGRTHGDQSRLQGSSSAFQKKVIGLTAAAGENDFCRMRIDSRRDLLTRLINRTPSRPAKFMPAGRIAELTFEPGQHGRQHRGIKRRCGVVVEVGGPEHGFISENTC